MDSAWEGWIRPVLLIIIAGLAGLTWYYKWLPDGTVGLILLAVLALAAAGVVVAKVWERSLSPRLRQAGLGLVALSLGLALWSPLRLLGPGAVLAAEDLTEDHPTLSLPALGSGRESYRVYVHGEPRYGRGQAQLRMALWSAPDAPHIAKRGKLLKKSTGGGGGQGASRMVESYDLIWTVMADLTGGGRIEIDELSDNQLGWPVRVELRRAPAPLPIALGFGALFSLIGLLIEVRARRGERTWLSTFAAGAPAFTALFGLWFAPGHLTETVFGAALVAVLIGTFTSYPLLAITRALRRPTVAPSAPQAPRAEVEGSVEGEPARVD